MRVVGIFLLVVNLTFVLALDDSNNEHRVHKISSSGILISTRSRSSDSDSTEQLSEDGHDEARRLQQTDEKQWEGRFEMVSNDGVTSGQKIEAFWGFFTAVFTAILSNIITRAAIHKLS